MGVVLFSRAKAMGREGWQEIAYATFHPKRFAVVP
jgi:hypothetical protein